MVARSLFCFIVAMVAMAFVWRPWHVFALRTILGFFAGYGPIAMTMAAESAPPEQMATALGWVQTAQRLGPALGPVLGGALAQAVGLRDAFLVASAFYVAAFVLVVVGYRDVRTSTEYDRPASIEPMSFAGLRRIPHFLLFAGTIFGLQLVDRSFGPVLPLYLREIGTTASRVPFMSGIVFTTAAGAAAVGNQSSAWLLERSTTGRIVTLWAGVAASAAVLFGIGPPTAALLGASVVFGFSIGVATTVLYTAASHAVPPGARGIAFGYLTTAYLVGLAVSPVLAGFVGAHSMRAVFFIDAVGLGGMALFVKKRMTT